jgi:hypothetical protein
MKHKHIITKAGGAHVFATALKVPYQTAASWKGRNSIPEWHWKRVVRLGLATMKQLEEGAVERMREKQDEDRKAAEHILKQYSTDG